MSERIRHGNRLARAAGPLGVPVWLVGGLAALVTLAGCVAGQANSASQAIPSPEPLQTVPADPSPTSAEPPPVPTVAATQPPTETVAPATAEPSQKLLTYVGGVLRLVSGLQRTAQNEDMPELLRAQRELLRELDRAALVLAVDRSPLAERLRAALPELLRGAEGDRQRLDRAAQSLYDALAQGNGTAAQKMPTPGPLARSLLGKILTLQSALRGHDAAALLRAQTELLAELDKIDQAVADETDFGSIRLRASVADVRAALDGDPARLDAVLDRLEPVARAASDPPRGGASAVVEHPPALSEAASASLRLRRTAKDLLERLEGVAAADTDALGQANRRLLEAIAAAEAGLTGNSVPEAPALREALVPVRQVAQGERAKLPAARAALEDVILRDVRRWTPLLEEHLAQLESAKARGDSETLSRARRRLQDVVEAARDATYYDLSPAADTLRQALVPLSEVARGDDTRLEDARLALSRVESGSP